MQVHRHEELDAASFFTRPLFLLRDIGIGIVSMSAPKIYNSSMGKNNKFRRRDVAPSGDGGSIVHVSSASPWTPVSVDLPREGAAVVETKALNGGVGGDDDDDWAASRMTRNHYDDPKLSRKAASDLPMSPGEDCAMFFGLEVLDASRYRVVEDGEGGTSKRLVIVSNDLKGSNDGEGNIGGGEDGDSTGRKRNHRLDGGAENGTKKRKKDKKGGKSNPDGSNARSDIASAEPQSERKQSERTTTAVEADSESDKMEDGTPEQTDSSSNNAKKNKKAKKKKKKKPTKASGGDATKAEEHDRSPSMDADGSRTKTKPLHQEPVTPDELAEIQSSWGGLSGGAHLHPRLLESLHRLGFSQPTPIQAATLSASIMGRRNLVGAAPTGSGKTLAFLLPILNTILEGPARDGDEDGDDDHEERLDDAQGGTDQQRQPPPKRPAVQALIMTPTRELASQIHAECDKLLPNQCATLVGGIALVKQARILQTKRPNVVIATPGRLWAMVRPFSFQPKSNVLALPISNVLTLKVAGNDHCDTLYRRVLTPMVVVVVSAAGKGGGQ